MLKKILIGLVVVIVVILGLAAMQPSHVTFARETVIKAPPEAIFPHINNNKKANDWMPWKDTDPQVQMNYSGPEEGVGSTSTWESQGDMGTGQAVVVESVPNQAVKTQLTYTKPMNMQQMAEITLTPGVEGTTVKWMVSGDAPFIARVICLFTNMQKQVEGQFDQGLAKLKTTVESGAAVPAETSVQ